MGHHLKNLKQKLLSEKGSTWQILYHVFVSEDEYTCV